MAHTAQLGWELRGGINDCLKKLVSHLQETPLVLFKAFCGFQPETDPHMYDQQSHTTQAAPISLVRTSFPLFLMEILVIVYTKVSITILNHGKVQIKGHVKLSKEQTVVDGILSDHFIQTHAYTIPTDN